MQLIESETLILYHTDLRGQWPEGPAQAFAARLPYARRLALRASRASDHASLAGLALALRALGQVLGRVVGAAEIVFAHGQKPRLAGACPDFSIAHSGHWVGCAAMARARVGFDVELGTDARRTEWVVREAALKATGEGLRALPEARQLRALAGRLRWRGALWHVRQLELFAGAPACVVSSRPVRELDTRAIALEELFAR